MVSSSLLERYGIFSLQSLRQAPESIHFARLERPVTARQPQQHTAGNHNQASGCDNHGAYLLGTVTRSNTAVRLLALPFKPLPCGTQNVAASVMRCDSCCLRFCQARKRSCSRAT